MRLGDRNHPIHAASADVLALSALQEEWERGTTFVAQFQSKGATIRVMRVGDRYSVLRYFQIAGKWQVSCDAQNAWAANAFETLARVL